MRILHALHVFILAGHLQLSGVAGNSHSWMVWEMRAQVTVQVNEP